MTRAWRGKLAVGPYGRLTHDGDRYHRHLTDEGKAIAEEYLSRFPRPIKVLRTVYPSLYAAAHVAGMDDEEIESSCFEAVVVGVSRWVPERCPSASTAITLAIRSLVQTELRGKRRRREMLACDMKGGPEWHPYADAPERPQADTVEVDEHERLANELLADPVLTERRRDTVAMYYGLNGHKPHTHDQIADKFGLSRRAAQFIRCESIDLLREVAGADAITNGIRARIRKAIGARGIARYELLRKVGGKHSTFCDAVREMVKSGELTQTTEISFHKRPVLFYRMAGAAA